MKCQLSLLCFLVSILLPPLAWGGADCDCAQVSRSELVARCGLIFLGTVESVRDSVIEISPPSHGHQRIMHRQAGWLRMLSIWKGTPRRTLTVFGLPKGYCNEWTYLEAGKTYLVFADSTGTGWTLGECGGPTQQSTTLASYPGLGTPVIVQRVPARKPATPK